MPITDISPQELEQMLQDQPDLQLIDVRTPQEFYYLGHIAQARLIPIYELPYAFRVLDTTTDVVITCQHGIRSVDACHFLQSQGFDRIYNLQEGMASWEGPVEKDLSAVEQLLHPQEEGD